MRAIIVKQPGGAEQLKIVKRAKPIPQENELLIKVKAIGVNRHDIITREQNTDQSILGVEVAGIVEKSSPHSSIAVGERVMGLVQGGYAEYATIPDDRAMLIPENLSFEQAAAINETSASIHGTESEYWKNYC